MYFHILETDKELIIDDRLDISWKEIIYYPLPFLVVLFYFRELWFIVLPLLLLVFLSYLFFRFFAWFLYKEIRINKINCTIEVVHFLLNRKRGSSLIDSSFSSEKITFLRQERSGEVKFLLRYSNYKNYDLLIVKSEKDRDLLESVLSKI